MTTRKKAAKKAVKKAAKKAEPPAPVLPVEAQPVEAEEELYSISRLAEYFELDRTTMRKRLEAAGVEPVVKKLNQKLYRLEDAEAAMGQEEKLEQMQLRKLTAETLLKELSLEQERGDLLPRKEVEDHIQKLFTAMYQRIAVRLPREIGAQLYKAESTAQLTTQLSTSLQTIFHELRNDHSRFLSSDQKSHS